MGESVARFNPDDVFSRGIGTIINLLGVTQREMGNYLDENQPIISQIVQGKAGPYINVFKKLQEMLEKHSTHPQQRQVEEEINKIRDKVLELTVGVNKFQSSLLTSYTLTPELINFVRNLYAPYVEDLGGTLLTRIGLNYPAAFFPAHNASFDEMLPKTNVYASENHVVSVEEYHRDPLPRLARLARNGELEQEDSESGWNLSMTSMSIHAGHPVLEVRLANYNQIVDSSDSMIYEIRRVFSEKPPDSITLADLPLRNRIHILEGNPLASARHRATGIGVAAPMCFLRYDNALATIVEKRSDRVGTYQRALHVIPAGMFGWRFVDRHAPHNNSEDPSFGFQVGDIELAMLVEYAEELFGKDEEASESGDRERTRAHPRIKTLMDECQAEIIPTGVCIDILNLRPEICAVIVVRDLRWWREEHPQVKLNWESLDYDAPNRRHDTIVLAPNNALSRLLLPEHTLPSGAGAFWYASDVAQRVWQEMHGR